MALKPSALGRYLFVLPDRVNGTAWQVAAFDANGQYRGGVVGLASEAAARAKRREL